jgi:hypothetical protein
MSILKLMRVHTWLASLIILISSIIVLSQVLFRSGLTFYGDFSVPITLESYSHIIQMPNTDPNMWFTYMFPFFASVSALHFSIEALIKLMLLAGLFLTGFSTYLAVNKILKDRQSTKKARIALASLVASFFYMFNPWSMDRIGHYFLWTSYAFAPLVLLLAIRITQQDKLNYKLIFLTSLIWSISSTSPFGALSNTMLLFSWILYSAVLTTPSRQYSKIAVYFKALVLTSSLYLLFNAHWILPYITLSMTQIVKPQYLLSWQVVESLSRNSNFPNVITLVANWWPQVQYWPNPPLYVPWILTSILLPLSAVTVLLLRRDKYTIYFSFMYIISILLSMGPNGPFPEIYKWMVFDAPLSNAIGWVFRDPNKWNSLTALAYSFFLGIFLYEMFSRNFKPRNVNSISRFRYLKKHAKSLLVVLMIVTSITLYMGPTVFGYFTQIYRPATVPQEYYDANNWLKNQTGDFRVLWLTPLSHGTLINGMFRYSWTPDKPYTSALDSGSSSKPSMAPTTYEAQRYTDFLYESIMEGRVDEYLTPLGIKYIVYHNDILGAETQGQQDIKNLMNQGELEQVWHEGFIYIFQVRSSTSRMSDSPNTLLVVGGLDSLSSLYLIPSFNFNDTSILFLEQKFYGASILDLTKNVVIVNKDVSDLALSFLDTSYLVAPFDYTIYSDPYTDWAKTDVYEDWWTWPSARNFVGYWDWDYGLGLVETLASNAKLNMEYMATSSGNYSIWMRYYESLTGGRISLSVDETKISEIDTIGERGFIWRKIGFAPLSEGKHNLVLENINGFNAVNLVALVPSSVEEKLFSLVQNLNIKYVLTPSIMRTEQLMIETEGTLFRGYDTLLSKGGFEEPQNVKSVTPNVSETLPFPIEPWTVTQWTGASGSLIFGVDKNESFEGGSSAVIESSNITNKGTIDFRTAHRASIEVVEPNKNSIRLYVSVMYKTSDDFITQEGLKLDIYAEDANGTWLGDFTSPIFGASSEWRQIYYIVDLPIETARFSPEIVATNFKGKVWFDDFNLTYKVTSISDEKEALILDKNTVAYANFSINNPSFWVLAMNAQSGSEGIKLSLKIDSTDINLPLKASNGETQWLQTDPIFLNATNYSLKVTSNVPSILNGIILYPWMQDNIGLETNEPPIINYTQISSSEWVVNVNATRPFMLGLTESYDPFWTASAEGFSTKSLPLYSVINGFLINKTGSYKLVIKYEPQFYFDVGLWIMATSITVSTLLVMVSLEREKHYISKIISRTLRNRKNKFL